MLRYCTIVLALLTATLYILAQPPQGPGGPVGQGGPGNNMFMGGPPMRQERKVLKEYDKNKDGWLNHEERIVAREALKKQGSGMGRGRPGGFGPPGMGRRQDPPQPGVQVSVESAASYPEASLYEPQVLRTLFFEFENKDWESELEDFHGTDVDIPAPLTVDGKVYPNVGLHFRGMSSFMGVGKGYKRSLNVSLDLANGKQRLYGHKTLNLLNAHEDPTYLNSVLYSYIAGQYIPTPKANLVKVVINGENWGIYSNVQQFNKEFTQEHFKTTKGARWKVTGSPGGRGGLEYLGDDLAAYKRIFEIKSSDDEKSWKALIHLCKVLNQTPADKLEEALKPILDVEGLLWFLALDVALINCDGYWIRASDYSIFCDEKGKFHIIPHDMNEAFRRPQGPGMGGGMMRMEPPGEVLPKFLQETLNLTETQKKQLAALQTEADAKLEKVFTKDQLNQWKNIRRGGPGMAGGPPPGPGGRVPMGGPGMGGPPGMTNMPRVNGVELDPLVGLTDNRKPLRSKILAVPAFRERYLKNIRTIAEKSLTWQALEPVISQYRQLIDKEVEADTRKLDSYDAFKKMTGKESITGERGQLSLKAFIEQRQKYLLQHAEVKKVAVK